MQKVMIIGSGGSGKSTLARTLGDLTKVPVYHLDALHWKPGWVPTPHEEWDELQKNLVKREKWIIDGNYGRTLDIRMQAADTIIFLDFSRWITLYRVVKRRIQYNNKTRPDMGEGCTEKIDLEFVRWVWNYRRDKRPGIMARLNALSDKKHVVILRTPNDVIHFLQMLKVTRHSIHLC